MKALIFSLIIGLLALSPVFANETSNLENYSGSDAFILLAAADERAAGSPEGRSNERTNDQQQAAPENGDDQDMGDVYRRTTYPPSPEGTTHLPEGEHYRPDPGQGFERVTPETITVDELRDANVFDVNHENIGNVEQVLMAPDGQIERVVITAGGFLGVGGHTAAVDMNDIDIFLGLDDDIRVYIQMTEEEFENQPEYQE
ncbi:PRC-barrel domain-containing protein [Desulfonatronum parangueonense]